MVTKEEEEETKRRKIMMTKRVLGSIIAEKSFLFLVLWFLKCMVLEKKSWVFKGECKRIQKLRYGFKGRRR